MIAAGLSAVETVAAGGDLGDALKSATITFATTLAMHNIQEGVFGRADIPDTNEPRLSTQGFDQFDDPFNGMLDRHTQPWGDGLGAGGGRSYGGSARAASGSELRGAPRGVTGAPKGAAGAENAANAARLRMQLSAEKAAGVRMPTEISGYTRHGLNQAISRDGVGVSGKAILRTWKGPSKIEYVPTRRGPSFRLTGPDAVVVINPQGKVVTTWPRRRLHLGDSQTG